MKTSRLSHSFQNRKLNIAKVVALSTIFVLTLSIFGLPVHRAHAQPFTFTNYEIARSWDRPSAGVNCPNTHSPPNCWNFHAEPNIAAAPDGTIYVSSENTGFNHLNDACSGNVIIQFVYICGGTGAWKSTDQGNHFTTLVSPNTVFPTPGTGVTAWGGDTHVAVATAKNSLPNPEYNVYIVSLEAAGAGLIGVGESTSTDGGTTWSGPSQLPTSITNPNSAIGVQDRPWVAAYGANEVCVESHTGAAVPQVFCSLDAGQSFLQPIPAFDVGHSWLTAETTIPGAIHIDPSTGYVYVPFSGVASAAEAANIQEGICGGITGISCPFGFHAVYMAVSPGFIAGVIQPFTDYQVYVNNANVHANYGEQFVAMALDSTGNPYEVYSDGVSLFYSYTRDKTFQTWQGAYQVNPTGSNWAVMPWATAGDGGKIDIVWYGSQNCNPTTPGDVDTCQDSATWNVYFAQNLNVFSNPTLFTEQAVTPGPNHMGPVCLNGGSCQPYRGLFDDFGVTADPITGLATIVYDNDMYTPDPTQNNFPNPDCHGQYTSSNDPRQQNCVHTNIAHQLSGPVITPPPPCRESDGEGDFHGTNGNGHFSFERDGCIDGDRDSVDETNRGDGRDFHSTEIDGVRYDNTAHTMTVVGLGTVNGLPVTFTFIAAETGLGTPGMVSFVYSDGYTNTGPLTSGSIILH